MFPMIVIALQEGFDPFLQGDHLTQFVFAPAEKFTPHPAFDQSVYLARRARHFASASAFIHKAFEPVTVNAGNPRIIRTLAEFNDLS